MSRSFLASLLRVDTENLALDNEIIDNRVLFALFGIEMGLPVLLKLRTNSAIA